MAIPQNRTKILGQNGDAKRMQPIFQLIFECGIDHTMRGKTRFIFERIGGNFHSNVRAAPFTPPPMPTMRFGFVNDVELTRLKFRRKTGFYTLDALHNLYINLLRIAMQMPPRCLR